MARFAPPAEAAERLAQNADYAIFALPNRASTDATTTGFRADGQVPDAEVGALMARGPPGYAPQLPCYRRRAVARRLSAELPPRRRSG